MKLEQKTGVNRGYMPLTASIPGDVTPQGVAKAFQPPYADGKGLALNYGDGSALKRRR
jgi:hypothetical protein